MPRIYIKSSTNILQKFKKGYTIPVGVSALGKFKSTKDDAVSSLIDEKENMLTPDQDKEFILKNNLPDTDGNFPSDMVKVKKLK